MGILTDLIIPHVYAAASSSPILITPVSAPAGPADANTLISNLTSSAIGILFLLGGSLAVIYLLWCGVQYITAGGNADQVKTARQGIVNAVIGIIIMMAAFAIIRFAVGIGTWLSKGAPPTGGSTTSTSGKNTTKSNSNSNSTDLTGSNCPIGTIAIGQDGSCIMGTDSPTPDTNTNTNSNGNTNSNSNSNNNSNRNSNRNGGF